MTRERFDPAITPTAPRLPMIHGQPPRRHSSIRQRRSTPSHTSRRHKDTQVVSTHHSKPTVRPGKTEPTASTTRSKHGQNTVISRPTWHSNYHVSSNNTKPTPYHHEAYKDTLPSSPRRKEAQQTSPVDHYRSLTHGTR
jgi:hypothetical protein